MTSTKHH